MKNQTNPLPGFMAEGCLCHKLVSGEGWIILQMRKGVKEDSISCPFFPYIEVGKINEEDGRAILLRAANAIAYFR
ncbi:hypothetical protein ACFOU2_18710 [Bacillus songklensis]|uniref:Uncharacterized protein n=1 Tax=Bacillus songklensis TaxID=1069116 RepID=A0ABV8B8B2_9BACI